MSNEATPQPPRWAGTASGFDERGKFTSGNKHGAARRTPSGCMSSDSES